MYTFINLGKSHNITIIKSLRNYVFIYLLINYFSFVLNRERFKANLNFIMFIKQVG